MDKEKNLKLIAGVGNAAAIFSALMIIVSMFMPYLNARVGSDISGSLGSGWKYLTNNGGGKRMAYLTLCLIFALGVGMLALLRLLRFPAVGTRPLSFVFAAAGLVLTVLSVMTLSSFKDSSGLDLTRYGAGLIVNLVFAVTAMLAAVGSATANSMLTRSGTERRS
jgi:hypothetical protein